MGRASKVVFAGALCVTLMGALSCGGQRAQRAEPAEGASAKDAQGRPLVEMDGGSLRALSAEAFLDKYAIDDEVEEARVVGEEVVAAAHDDGAAEAAVDFALRFNKPFAIVPCCTCSKDFPNRTMEKAVSTVNAETGEAQTTTKRVLVKSYEDLVEYLRRKDSRIRSDRLGFGGKNQVLYMLPEPGVLCLSEQKIPQTLTETKSTQSLRVKVY